MSRKKLRVCEFQGKNVTLLDIVFTTILCIIKMLFEGQGNAEERPEYQIMIKRKGSNTSFFTSFSVILFVKPQGLGQSPNYLNIIFFLQG